MQLGYFHPLFFSLILLPAGGFMYLKSSMIILYFILASKRLFLNISSTALLYFLFGLFVIFTYALPTIHTESGLRHLTQLSILFILSFLFLTHINFIDSIERLKLRNILIKYCFFYSLSKVVIFILFLFGVLSYKSLSSQLGTIGFVFQDFSWWGFPGVVRITSANDFVIACLLLIYIVFGKFYISGYIIFFYIFALIVSFSRVFILLAFVGGIYLISKKIKRIFLFIVIVFLLLISFLDIGAIYNVFEFRFSDVTSGETKILQTYYLADSYIESYGLGRGVGFYLPSYIRSTTELFTYENHIAQLLLQIGPIGLCLILFPYVYTARFLSKTITFSLVVYVISILLMNTTNPYFNSITTLIMIFIHFTFGSYYDEGSNDKG